MLCTHTLSLSFSPFLHVCRSCLHHPHVLLFTDCRVGSSGIITSTNPSLCSKSACCCNEYCVGVLVYLVSHQRTCACCSQSTKTKAKEALRMHSGSACESSLAHSQARYTHGHLCIMHIPTQTHQLICTRLHQSRRIMTAFC